MSIADEHREWHRINGAPEVTVCPWDCYDPPEPERCPACYEYENPDGTCPRAGTPEHDEIMTSYLSALLSITAEHEKAAFERKQRELEADPWF